MSFCLLRVALHYLRSVCESEAVTLRIYLVVDTVLVFVVNLVHWPLGSHYATASINELTRSSAIEATYGRMDALAEPCPHGMPFTLSSSWSGGPYLAGCLSINKWMSSCLPTPTKLVFIRDDHRPPFSIRLISHLSTLSTFSHRTKPRGAEFSIVVRRKAASLL